MMNPDDVQVGAVVSYRRVRLFTVMELLPDKYIEHQDVVLREHLDVETRSVLVQITKSFIAREMQLVSPACIPMMGLAR